MEAARINVISDSKTDKENSCSTNVTNSLKNGFERQTPENVEKDPKNFEKVHLKIINISNKATSMPHWNELKDSNATESFHGFPEEKCCINPVESACRF